MSISEADISASGMMRRLGTRARVTGDVLYRLIRSESAPLEPRFRAESMSEVVPCRPGLFESDQMDRVLACAFECSVPSEIAKLTETSFRERPAQVAELGPSILAGGRILSAQDSYFLSGQPVLKAAFGQMQEFGRLNIASSYHGLKYFGHWLRDDCPLYEKLCEDGPAYFMRYPDWLDRALYKDAFFRDAQELSFARADNLVLHTEQGFSRDKARRMRVLRARLRQQHPPTRSGHVVYVSRGLSANQRDMDNRAEFEDGLRAQGVRIVHPDSDPRQMVQEMLDARMIITIEGSQAAHGAYMLAEGGAMLILQTPHRFYNAHHEWARLLGMHYGTVVGRPANQSYHMDLGEVLQMMDRLSTQQAKSTAGAV